MLRQVVRSKAGKDCGGFFVILAEEEGFAYIADGKLRKVEKPKRKNARHLAPTDTALRPEDCETNKKLRAALAGFNMKDEGGNSLVQRRRD
ncbi:MAG TPA: KOW domain-containing RNA-binding protein [Oscillospiraceae bacterium]|nr:KOW domain-containing RNA-binding protein [Oscillospiraceae bacterium]HNW04558.1 KOW domain-containing RNA-binding protein [Oscillospiraceae bacterium]